MIFHHFLDCCAFAKKMKNLNNFEIKSKNMKYLAFHGTDTDNITSIIENGFILDKFTNFGATYGRGVYLSPYPIEARCYSDSDKVIVCEVVIDNPFIEKTKQNKRMKNIWQRTYDTYINRFGTEYVIRDPFQITIKGVLEVKI